MLFAASIQPTLQDWPQWGGPHGTGVSAELDWTSTGPPETLWSRDVGVGPAGIVIQGDALFTLGHDEARVVDVVSCLDAQTGSERWTFEITPKSPKPKKIGARTTPAIDGDRLYVTHREGLVLCLNAANGETIWTCNQREELQLEVPSYGFAASPQIVGDALLTNAGVVTAYDKRTGHRLWRSERNYGPAYSTPLVFDNDGVTRIASFAGEGLAILDAGSGEEIAFTPWVSGKAKINAMTPVPMDDGLLVSSGVRGCARYAVTNAGLELVWVNRSLRAEMTGPVPHAGHLYGFDRSVLTCIDGSGRTMWRERGLGAGALIVAGDRLVVLSEDGELVIAEATPDEYREIGRARVLEEGPCWTPPVLADGRIYCRSVRGELVCVDRRSSVSK